MKLKTLSWLGLIAVMASPLCSVQGQSPPATAPAPAAAEGSSSLSPHFRPNVAEVVKLSNAGLGNDLIVAFVNGARPAYNLSANEVLQLKDAGVSAAVIKAMLDHDASRGPRQAGQVSSSNAPPAPTANPAPAGPPPREPEPPYYPGQGAPQPQPNAGFVGGGFGGGNAAPAHGAEQLQPQAPPQPAPPPTVIVQQPPPLQVEYIPVAPGPDYYWAPGYWGWDNGWVWIGGRWGWGWGWGGYRGGWGGHHDGHWGGGGFHGGHGGHR